MSKKKVPELKIEPICGRGNLHYLALVEYKREQYLCLIDNIKSSELGAYVLDYAEQENIDMKKLFSAVNLWFYSQSDSIPISVEFARHGLSEWVAPIYRTFDTTYVSRIIGKTFSYESQTKTKVRRRRVVAIPEGIAIRMKKNLVEFD